MFSCAKKKIIIFGSSGLLGSSLYPYLSSLGYNVCTVGRSRNSDFILKNFEIDEVKNVLDRVQPDCVINLIAATNVDACEVDVKMAMQTNALIPKLMSSAILQSSNPKLHFIHISTDQVYDGAGNHREEEVCPINVYGVTKLMGEAFIQASSYTILRTNFFGKSRCDARISFTDWIYKSIVSDEQIKLFDDVIFNALHIDTLCKYIGLVLNHQNYGVYNLGSRNGMSKADFGIKFSEILKLKKSVLNIGSCSEVKLIAKRPMDMTTNINKFEAAFGEVCPNMIDEIYKCAEEYGRVYS